MHEENNEEVEVLKRKPFFKFHERIHTKYEEMQRKIAKSKSVDVLSNLSEDFDFKEHNSYSTIDLRESDNTSIESDRQSINTQSSAARLAISNAVHQDIYRESSVSELVEDYAIERDDKESELFFGDDFSRISLESVNEIGVESDDETAAATSPVTPLTKLSIRNRLAVAIERRKVRKREKEIAAKKKEIAKEKKKEAREGVEKFVLSNTTKQDVFRIKNKLTKVATVTIALIEATGLETDNTEDKARFLFCRFRLGGEKHKSKLIRSYNSKVKWQELLNLHLYDEHMLEITLWDKDSFIGRTIIDLSALEKEHTHKLRINLECDIEKTELFILLTISGNSLVNSLVDIDDYEATKRQTSDVKKQYAWYHLMNNTGDVGMLSVIVYGAKGLISNETYCVLQLGNERLQTQTEYKTNDPNWMKIFTFPVNDITSILEVTVHDDKKSEDIAKISIPLLGIQNGQQKWYALKDVLQRERAKGNNARILLEMRVTWNILRASVRVINPKEVNYLETKDKLQRHIFARNLTRARAVVNWIFNAFRVVITLFEWESRTLNIVALILWLLFCWFFRMWMLPLLLLVPFIWYRPNKYILIIWERFVNEEIAIEIYEDPKKEKEEKTSWRHKLNSLTDMVQTVQIFIGQFASYGESIKNLFNFTVPFLSCLAIILITLIAFVMYLIPVTYIFMFWGIHKFTRKILWPTREPNNEILDLLSRVPDDETLLNTQQLELEEVEDVIN